MRKGDLELLNEIAKFEEPLDMGKDILIEWSGAASGNGQQR